MEVLLEKQATDISESYSKEIKGLEDDIKSQLKRFEEQSKEGTKAHSEQITALKNAIGDYNEKSSEMQKHLDELDIKLKKGVFGSAENKKSFDTVLLEGLKSYQDAINKKVSGTSNLDISINMHSKAVGDMSAASNFTGEVIDPFSVAGVVGTPYNMDDIRQYLPTGTVNSNSIRHIQFDGGEGAPTPVAEGALKPQMDFDFSVVDTPVRKLAGYVRFPEEMLEDAPAITSFIRQQGLVELRKIENAQLYSGSGTGQDLSGLTTNAAAFAAGTLANSFSDANEITVLRAAINQVRLQYLRPTVILMSPTDVVKIKELRSTTNQYLVTETLNKPVPSLDGIPIVQNTEVAEGEFLLGDMSSAVQLYDRQTANVRLYDQDRDNPIRNMITAVIEERLALVTYRPYAMVYGDFATAKTALQTV